MQVIYLVGAVLAVGLLYVLLPTIVDTYLRLRGKRVVTCPETKAPAGVEVDARRGALASVLGRQG